MTTDQIREYTHCFVRAWHGRYPAHADPDGTVRVYDPCAGHFTACHSLTPAQERWVRAMAKQATLSSRARRT